MSERSHPHGYEVINKLIAMGCIFLQLLSPVSALVAIIPVMAEAGEQHMLPHNTAPQTVTGVNPFEQSLAKGAVAFGTTLSDEDRTSSEALSDYARSQANDVLNSNAERWLSKYGTARVQLNVEKNGRLGDSSADWLVPLYDSPKNMLFTQLGLRQKDDRKTLNLGIGNRIFTEDNWMLGLNTFFDSDLTGHNYRLGIGAEAWSDYVKFSGNVYRRLSGWHQSRDLDDYDERPANGFDLRFNGFMPAWPQLGGTLVYEQYFGDEVALFGEDDRQKDPYAFTVGANYTPIPLLTFSAEQRMGKSDQNELNLALNMTWQLDKSLRENLSPESVAGMRKLSHSRYDLVERNNDIVLEYRKQQVIRLSLSPEEIAGTAGSQQQVAVNITAKHGVKNIQAQGASFTAAGGTISPVDASHYTLTLPAWQQPTTGGNLPATSDASRILNTYVLVVTAEDNEGNHSSPEHLKIEVLPPVARFSGEASVTNDFAQPDGVTPVTLLYRVVDDSNKPVTGENIAITANFADGTTRTQNSLSDTSGNASLELTSTVAGEAKVAARLSSGESNLTTVHYIDDQPDAAHSSLTASPATLVANGLDKSTLMLILRDSQSRPVTELDTVKLTLSGVADATLSRISEAGAGHYTATLSGTSTGTVTVTPTVGDAELSGLSTNISLIGDSKNAHVAAGDLMVLEDNAYADGSSQNLIGVKVTDAQGNLIPGQTVQLKATNGAVIASEGISDAKGMLSMPVTSNNAGVSTITATLNGNSQNVAVTFVADNESAQIANGDLSVITDNSLANGTAENQIQVKVADQNGNALNGQTIDFSADNGAVVPASATSGADGSVQIPVTSKAAGSSTVTATVNGTRQSVNVTFVADGDSAQIAAGALTVVADKAVANGSAVNQIQATVTDQHDNPVAGAVVSFTADNGATVSAQEKTDEQGLAVAQLTSKTAGSSTVNATVNGSSQTVAVVFIADSSTVTLADGALTVTADNALANGNAANQVQMRVTDANGNTVADQPVSLTASNGAVIAPSGITGPDGLLKLPVTSLTAGVSSVTATVDNSSQSVDVAFMADSSSAGIAAGDMTVVANNALANGTAVNTVKVRVTDANGNPLAGQTVTLSTGNGATASEGGVTDNNGERLVNVTSTVAGASTVTATVNSSSQSVEITFVPDGDSARIASGDLSVINDNAVANGIAEDRIQVKVTDRNGNVVSGQSVAFKASNGAIVLASGSSGTDGTLQIVLTSKTAGISTVIATVNGSDSQIEVQFTADKSSARIASGSMQLTADKALANGTAENRVQVLITDANDNPLASQAVSFSASKGAVINSSGTTGSDGKIEMPVTATIAGSSTVTATVNSSSQSIDMRFVADGSTAQIAAGALTVVADKAVANGSAVNQIQATVTDQHDNPVAGAVVSFTADNGATVSAQEKTDEQGLAVAQLTSKTAGNSTVNATVNGSSQTVAVVFIADSSTVTLADGALTVTADNALANGNAANQVQMRVTDANGNTVADQPVSLTASNGAVIAPSGITGPDGLLKLPVTSLTAGVSSVTAMVDNSSQSVDVAFMADSSSAGIAAGDMTVVANSALANGTAVNTVKVRVTDANGNPLAGQTVTLSTGNGATASEGGVTDNNGERLVNVTSTVAGASTVTATVNSSSLSVEVIFTADSGNATVAAADMVLLKDNAKANGSDSDTVQVTVRDPFGNPVPDQKVNFIADNSAVVETIGTTDEQGVVTMPVVSHVAGTSNITASVNGSSQNVSLTFIADSTTAQILASDIVVTQNGALSDGSAQNQLQVKVTDANGNVVGGVVVAFTATNEASVAASVATDTDGLAMVPVTSKRSGTSLVTASINSSSQSAEMTFIAATIPVITSVEDNVGSITGNITGEQVTNDPQPELQGQSDKSAIIRLFDNDTLVATSAANESGVWSITPDAVLLEDGEHRLTVTAALTEDSDQSPSSDAFILNLDTLAQIPTIDTVTDSNGAVAVEGMTNGDSVRLSGTTEPGATVKVYVIRMADRLRALLGSPVADKQGKWELKITDMRLFQGSGEYEFRATTTDIAGNTSKDADMTGYSINYESWPAPVGTPEYLINGDGETVSEEQVASLLSSTGEALFAVRTAGLYTSSVNVPAASAGNKGNRVYVSVGTGTKLGVRIDSAPVFVLEAGTNATWYSNGSTWKRIY